MSHWNLNYINKQFGSIFGDETINKMYKMKRKKISVTNGGGDEQNSFREKKKSNHETCYCMLNV